MHGVARKLLEANTASCPQIAVVERFLIESNNKPGGFLYELSGRKDFMNDRQPEYQRLLAPIEDQMMRAVWRVVRDPSDTEDAFQEALLRIWKRWDRICTHPNPHALILQNLHSRGARCASPKDAAR